MILKNKKKKLSSLTKLEGNNMKKNVDAKELKGTNIKNCKSTLNIKSKLLKKLSDTELKLKKNFEVMLRSKAELENYKKRSKREISDFKKYALEFVMKDLLIIVDNLERAIQSSRGNNKNIEGIIEGLTLTLNELLKILTKYNVISIKSTGKEFDPKIHQAMTQKITSKYPNNTVIKEFLKGYIINDRLLRPSMVAVSKQPEKLNNDKKK